uniref:Uncharacterized protein n=1 Tax=Strigamia maritima TaxID=126957 RepID=T1INX8_STRMM
MLHMHLHWNLHWKLHWNLHTIHTNMAAIINKQAVLEQGSRFFLASTSFLPAFFLQQK